MSAHTARPGSRPRRPAHAATLATVATIAPLAAACTSTTGPGTSASVVAAANTAGGRAPTLTGAGCGRAPDFGAGNDRRHISGLPSAARRTGPGTAASPAARPRRR